MRDLWVNWVYSGYSKSVILTTKIIRRFPIHTLLLLFASQKNYTIKRAVPKATVKRRLMIRPILDSKELIYTTFYKK